MNNNNSNSNKISKKIKNGANFDMCIILARYNQNVTKCVFCSLTMLWVARNRILKNLLNIVFIFYFSNNFLYFCLLQMLLRN